MLFVCPSKQIVSQRESQWPMSGIENQEITLRYFCHGVEAYFCMFYHSNQSKWQILKRSSTIDVTTTNTGASWGKQCPCFTMRRLQSDLDTIYGASKSREVLLKPANRSQHSLVKKKIWKNNNWLDLSIKVFIVSERELRVQDCMHASRGIAWALQTKPITTSINLTMVSQVYLAAVVAFHKNRANNLLI